MKKHIFLFGMMVLIAGCVIYVPREYSGDYPYPEDRGGGYDYRGERFADELGPDYFYQYLDPHGFWTRLSPYGYIWVPHSTAYDWRPYTSGRWFWTDQGWTWASSYSWGWACFHFGRWGWDQALGWYWVPGTVWGPAWVAWRLAPGHIGWAPIPPHVRFEWEMGISSLPHPLSETSWVFVEDREFASDRLSRSVLPPERNLTFVRASQLSVDISVQEDRVMNPGPDPSRVSDAMGSAVREHQLRSARSPGQPEAHTGFLYVYTPEVRDLESSEPTREAGLDEVGDMVIERKIENYQEQGEKPVEEEIRRLQEGELEKLEDSQQTEVERLEKQTQEKIRQSENEAEKDRAERERREQLSRTRERHEAEKARITKRHSEEREKVSKAAVPRKKKK